MGDLRRLIVFDLDGTLVDSRRDLADSANALLEERGAPPLAEEAIGRMVGEGAAVLVRRALAAAGVAEPPGAVERFLAIYSGRLLNNTRAYDGVPEALSAAARHARLAVLTNKPVRFSEEILDGLALRDLFDDVVGGDGPWPRKPDPASLLALMERAGAAAASTLFVGDSAIDHETAHRASVRCCLAAYGFGYETFPRDRLTEEDWVAADAEALAGCLRRFTGGG